MKENIEVRWYPRSAGDTWDLGMSVVRLREPRLGDPDTGKATIGPWKQLQYVRLTKREAEAISGQYGIVTGKVSKIVVVDVDREDLLEMVLKELADTPMRTRTSKGWHLYYRHPGVEVRNRAKLRKLPLDVRGDGGYVVGPGSMHWSGRRYEAEGNWSSIDALPMFDPSWLEEVRKFKGSAIEPSPADPVKRAALYISRIEGAVQGAGGSNVTMRVAGILIQKFGLSVDQALPLFIMWNMKCSPPWTERELLHKLQDAVKNLASQREPIIKAPGG